MLAPWRWCLPEYRDSAPVGLRGPCSSAIGTGVPSRARYGEASALTVARTSCSGCPLGDPSIASCRYREAVAIEMPASAASLPTRVASLIKRSQLRLGCVRSRRRAAIQWVTTLWVRASTSRAAPKVVKQGASRRTCRSARGRADQITTTGENTSHTGRRQPPFHYHLQEPRRERAVEATKAEPGESTKIQVGGFPSRPLAFRQYEDS